MKVILDLIILVASSVMVGLHLPLLGMFLFIIGLLFIIQAWKTTLLQGRRTIQFNRIRLFQALILALLISIAVGIGVQSVSLNEGSVAPALPWTGELFPIYIGVILLSGLTLIDLISEKRKR